MKKSTKKTGISSLSDFSDIITRMGERKRKEDDDFLQNMKDGLDDHKKAIRKMPNVELVEYLERIPFSTYDIRRMEVWDQIRSYTKAQIIKRMK
jgi:predicted CopG family antitoxin